jgi:hypothetical protein
VQPSDGLLLAKLLRAHRSFLAVGKVYSCATSESVRQVKACAKLCDK